MFRNGSSGIAEDFTQLQRDCLAMQGVLCRRCGEVCGLGAIRFRHFAGGYARPEFDAAACDGCAACLAACPLRVDLEAAA